MIRAYINATTKAVTRAVIPGSGFDLSFKSPSSFNSAENQTDVGTVSLNQEGATYSIVSGLDGAKFTIDPNTGVLSLASPLDYEIPTDTYNPVMDSNGNAITDENGDFILEETGNADGTYYLVVRAELNGKVAHQTIAVTITDIYEITPFVISLVGIASGTPTPVSITISCTENVNVISTGDAVIDSLVRSTVAGYVKHVITASCPVNGTGNVEIEDTSKIVSLGPNNGTYGAEIGSFVQSSTTETAPTVRIDLSKIPPNCQKIFFGNVSGSKISPFGIPSFPDSVHTILIGTYQSVSYTGSLPAGLRYLSVDVGSSFDISGTIPPQCYFYKLANGNQTPLHSLLALPLTELRLWGTTVTDSSSDPLPASLKLVELAISGGEWLGLDIPGSSNITSLNLNNFRNTKMSSSDMVTLLTNLKNRAGGLPNSITINEYADYASPPQSVTDAVAALKLVKTNVTTVTLGA